MTIVSFSNPETTNLTELCTRAKKYCASGGTVKGNTIELQGDHRQKMRKFLIKEGFDPEHVEIISE
ncbi:MAG: hypothetical protein Kow0069_01900 [Promethearchaeota archaeon]